MKTSLSELLDVVDDRDQVIGTLTRGEIHRRELKHRSVHVLVFDGDGSVLLQKRSMEKDECAGMWDTSCAGHVESGQDYAEMIYRCCLKCNLQLTTVRSLRWSTRLITRGRL